MTLVDLLADLAKLRLNTEEKERLSQQIKGIIDYVSRVKSFNTDGLEPTFHTNQKKSVFREDKRENSRSLGRKETLANAHEKIEGYFKVPAILEQ